MRYLVYNLVRGASMLISVWPRTSYNYSDERRLAVNRAQAENTDVFVASKKNFKECLLGAALAALLCLVLILTVTASAVLLYAPGASLPAWLYVLGVSPTLILVSAFFLERKLRPTFAAEQENDYAQS